jgi:hypothetical protein
MLSQLNQFAALLPLSGADYLTVFTADQLQALVMVFLELQKLGTLIATIFWGLWLFPLGYLVYKSGYFPKIFGVLVIIAGFGYLLGSFTHFLLPNLEAIFPVFELLTFGEVIFMVWVLLKGAKIPEMKS